jgi:hypothetical protein
MPILLDNFKDEFYRKYVIFARDGSNPLTAF